jgi:uncharacterized protein YjbI with pentapeptide repeats
VARDAPLLALGLTWTIVLLAVSMFLPTMPVAENKPKRKAKVDRGTRTTLALALFLSAALVAIGIGLWLDRPDAMGNANSDLGAALLGAAVVPVAIFLLEYRFASLAAARDALEAKRRDDSNERNHSQLMTATLDELPGIDLAGRDLSGFYLRKKNLRRAKLIGCELTRAQLEGTDLTGAELQRSVLASAIMVRTHLDSAVLTEADLSESNLRGAFLINTTLTGANLGGTSLAGADLRGAVLIEADLRGAKLRYARNVSSCTLSNSRYDDDTSWPPPPFDAGAAGATGLAFDDPWKSAAALKEWEAVVE